MTARLAWTLATLLATAPAIANRLVARSGTLFPTDNLTASFSAFNAPTLDPTGRVAFLATVTGEGVEAGQELGVWSEASGFLTQVARAGDLVPNDPMAAFASFADPLLSPSGATSFVAQLVDDGVPGSVGLSVWQEFDGVLGPTIRRGDRAPDTPAGTVFEGSGLVLTGSAGGELAFEGFVSGPGVGAANDEILYAGDGQGGWRVVAREGDPAPDADAAFADPLEPIRGANGAVAFLSPLTGARVTAANNVGVWSDASGRLSLLARTGEAAPGAPRGGAFRSFSPNSLRINSSGAVTFIAATSPTLGGAEDQGVWSDRSGSLAPIALTGDPAPGVTDGEFDVFSEVRVNRRDRAALIAFATGPGVTPDNRLGVWSEGLNGLQLVAREGDLAPGVEDGAVFSSFAGLSLNRWGQTAFFGSLRGAGVTEENDNGIWVQRLDGSLRLVVREGDPIDVGAGGTSTVSAIAFAPGDAGESGGRSGLNDRGQVGFAVRLEDGSAGLFVSNAGLTLPGDFNGDGVVDAADYSVWRDALGGVFGPLDFDDWVSGYGAHVGSFAVATPEPSGGVLIVFAAGLAVRGGRRGACS